MTTLIERFEAKIDRTDEGCWIWTGATTSSGPHGYGRFTTDRVDGVQQFVVAHRFAYEMWVGPIPDGMTLDHICSVTRCVNPAHLRPMTLRDNILIGSGPAAINASKTTCIRGHDLSEALVQRRPNGGTFRQCRACRRVRYAERTSV